MSAVKQPSGYAITRNNLLPTLAPLIPRKRFLTTLAATVVAAMTLGKIAGPTDQDVEWANLTSPTPIHPIQSTVQNHFAIPVTTLEWTSPGSQPASLPQPPWLDQEIQYGDTLSLIFKRAGYGDQDVYDIVNQSTDGKSLEKIFPGQTIAFQTDDSGSLVGVRHTKSQLETVTYLRTEAGFESQLEVRAPELREAWTTGVITSSLFFT